MPQRWSRSSHAFSSTTNAIPTGAWVAKRWHLCDPWPRPNVMIDSVSSCCQSSHQSARQKAAIPWWTANQVNTRRHVHSQQAAAATGPAPETLEAVMKCCEPAAADVLHPGRVQLALAGPVAGARAGAHGALPRNNGLCASEDMLLAAGSSGCVASSSSTAEYLLHSTDPCSSLYSPVSIRSARSASAGPAASSGPAAATPGASDGPAAHYNGDDLCTQQLDAVSSSTGDSDGAGAGSSSGGNSSGSCSSDDSGLPGTPGEVEGLGGGGGPADLAGPASDGANHDEQSRRPLVEEAKAYLLRHFPESADVWKLLRAEDLQCAEHQKAYVALQQHIYGMRFRVEFGNKYNTRDLTRGIAFLDPRPASHIMHNNTDKTRVRAADGSISVPDTISVQDYMLNKHNVVLQHPEWPCVGYKLLNSKDCEKPSQPTDFRTYPMEFCSVLLGAHSEPKRKSPCDPWVHVWLEALPGAAQVPSWIAEVLNVRCSQQEQATASVPAAAVALTAGKAQAAIKKQSTTSAGASTDVQPHGQHVIQAITGMAASAGSVGASLPVVQAPDPTGLTESAAPSVTAVDAAVAAMPDSLTPESPGEAPPTCHPPTAASAYALQRSSHLGIRQAPGSSSGTQLDNLQSPTSSSTAAVFSSSGRPTSVENGYRKLLSQLPPSKDQERVMRRVSKAVCRAICSIRESNKMEWQVTEVIKAGSFAKKTSLRDSSDLDVVVKIKCHAPFHRCRKKLLTAILQHLRQRSGDGGEDEAEYGWLLETVPQGCHVHYYIKLEHPMLGLQLDIQVAEHYGEKKVQKEVLLGQLLEAAAMLEAGPVAACASSSSRQQAQVPGGHSNTSGRADGPAVAAVAASGVKGRQVTRKDVYSDRQRVTNLTELMTDVVKGVHERCDQRGFPGMGSLITNTIRMMKAWSKFGLPKALAASAAARRASACLTAAAPSTSATTDAAMMSAAATVAPAAADTPKGPPGYIWEIFVVYVLEHRSNEGKIYHPGQPLYLFLDVLHEASQHLRSSMKKSEAIIVPLYYTCEQALSSVLQDEWGEDGCPYAPYIISPVDPSYNCNENAAFRDYDALADAAGQLYERVNLAKVEPKDWQWLCQNSTLGPVATEFGVDT